MYFPSRERVPPASLGLYNVEERVLATPDGEHVIAWYGRAQPAQPTLLYFHGNGGNLALRAERVRKYLQRGRGMFMMSYRGYSGSTGGPSEAANVADARLAYDALVMEGVRPDDIILYGESLGSGVATRIAAEKQVGGLILDAPFTSAVDVGARHYPILPVRPLLHDRYDTIRWIGQVTAPLLVVHGGRDAVIPIAMGRQVFDAAKGPKEFAAFPEAGHEDHYLYGSYDVIEDWIDQLWAGRQEHQIRPETARGKQPKGR
jgi:fermentation-respiration switch protein FrsA (DUF1100 family)